MPYTVLRPIGPYWRASCWELQKSIHKYAMQYWAGKVAGACCAENFRGEFGSVGLSLSWLVSWKAGVSLGCMPLLQNQKSEATQFGHSVCFFILFCCGTLRWSPNPFGAKKKKQSFWEKAQWGRKHQWTRFWGETGGELIGEHGALNCGIAKVFGNMWFYFLVAFHSFICLSASLLADMFLEGDHKLQDAHAKFWNKKHLFLNNKKEKSPKHISSLASSFTKLLSSLSQTAQQFGQQFHQTAEQFGWIFSSFTKLLSSLG